LRDRRALTKNTIWNDVEKKRGQKLVDQGGGESGTFDVSGSGCQQTTPITKGTPIYGRGVFKNQETSIKGENRKTGGTGEGTDAKPL